jgi:protein-tyrosine phosphatase
MRRRVVGALADVGYRIVFVCLGNICRSPMAEVVMRAMVDEAGLSSQIEVASAGTGDWHVGERADARALDALRRRGYDGSAHHARQFGSDSYDEHDLVVALDSGNLAALRRLAPAGRAAGVRLLLSFDPEATEIDVPDPYYGGPAGFDDVLEMVERACRGLLAEIRSDLPA